MKRIITAIVAVIAGMLALSSCSKSGTTTTPTGSTFNMTATIAGAAFSRDSCVFYHNNVLDTTDADILGWAGFPKTRSNYYPQIYLYFYSGFHGIGTYVFTNPGNFSAQVLLSDTSGSYATSGSITINAVSPNVAGTFSFTTSTGVAVTNGSFTALRQ